MTGRPGSVSLPDQQAQGSAGEGAPERAAWPPGDLAIWIFILAELAVFAIFFAAYAFARMGELELFVTYQQTLDTNLALINTLALITSSYFVVRAVGRIRADDARGCIRWLAGALALGGLFLGVKSIEYAHLFGEGVRLSTNTFYTFYLSLTFFHFLHVVMGMVILAAVAVKAAQGHYGRAEYTGVETGASYWHMVDLVWLILFPLVYVM
ncbi:MAG: cytochrome-c oxidase [Gammaproteobacteria bacterium]|nr:cytochrome-c oxidase [Gammaproteobacteria bacterium]